MNNNDYYIGCIVYLIVLVFYIIGVLLAYYLCKRANEKNNDHWRLETAPVFSWFIVAFCLYDIYHPIDNKPQCDHKGHWVKLENGRVCENCGEAREHF